MWPKVPPSSAAFIEILIDSYMFCLEFICQALRRNGAIPFIRTSVVQTMMSLGDHNPLHGLTHNPCDLTRTPGGSSSGEGAALASGASLIGIGSDIGQYVTIVHAFTLVSPIYNVNSYSGGCRWLYVMYWLEIIALKHLKELSSSPIEKIYPCRFYLAMWSKSNKVPTQCGAQARN